MKKVLIIGAGFLQSYVIKKAKELGYYTLAVDGNPNAEGFKYADESAAVNIIDEKACLEYARKNKIDGVLTAATDYGVLSAAYVARELSLNGIEYDAARLIKNKYEFRKRLYEAGADDTELSYEIKDEQSLAFAKANVKFPIMVKPCDGSGSRGAARVDDECDFAEACRFAMSQSLTHRATAEPFIDGLEYGAESFVCGGEIHVLAVMKKQMTRPPYYAELGHALPSGLSADMEEKVRACVKKAIKALGINFGSVNMDILLTGEGGVHIIDIGARMGGNLIGSHIVPLGTGIDYMANMIRAAVGDDTDFAPKKKAGCVSTRLLALTPGKIAELPDFEKIKRETGVIIEHHLHIGDTINEYHTNLDGCGYVVASADTYEEAEKLSQRVKEEIDSKIVRRI